MSQLQILFIYAEQLTREVTQKSLRHAIGVVPQDSVLFNTSIRYNIGYGKFGSSTEEIEAAAKSAQMHDRILSFPQGYDFHSFIVRF